MTLPTNVAQITYTGNGSTTSFAFPYLVKDSSHFKVYHDSALQASGFTLSGIGTSSITVTYTTAPASGVEILFLREVPLTQNSDYVTNDPLPAETLEGDLDIVTMGLQQLDNQITRALRAPDGETIGDMGLAGKASRANKYILFDANGLPTFVTAGPDSSGGLVTSSSGTTARSLASRFDDLIDILDYGGAGDDSTDNVTAITAAKLQNSAIYFPPGTYRINSNITIDNVVLFEGAVLKPGSGATLTLGTVQGAGWVQVFDESLGGNVVLTATGVVCPDWWGALPDNSTVGTTEINAALGAHTGGATVKFGVGTYVIDGALNVPSNTIVEGCGLEASTIRTTQDNSPVLNFDDVDYCIARDITLKGPHPGGTGNNVVGGNGIDIIGTTAPCTNIHIYNCRIVDMHGNGISMTTDNVDIFIHGNRIENVRNGVIVFKGNSYVWVCDNRFDLVRVISVFVDDATSGDTQETSSANDHVTIRGNLIKDGGKDTSNNGAGIAVSSSSYVTIVGNIIEDIGVVGTHAGNGIICNVGQDDFNPCDNITIIGNLVTGVAGGSGIKLEGCRNVTVSGNVLVDNNEWDGALSNAAEILIQEFSGGAGSVAEGISVSGNTIRNTGATNARSIFGLRVDDANCDEVYLGGNAIVGLSSGEYSTNQAASGAVNWQHVGIGTLPAWTDDMIGRVRYNTADNALYVATNTAWVVVGTQT